MYIVVVFLYCQSVAAVNYPPDNCHPQYFNPVALACVTLEPGFVEDSGVVSCNSQYKAEYTSQNTLELTCTACSGIASLFGERCITCPAAVVSGRCECDYTTSILVDTELDGTIRDAPACVPCIEGFTPGQLDKFGVPRRCTKCRYQHCECDVDAGFCFAPGYLKTAVQVVVRFDNGENIESKLLKNNLRGVSALCSIDVLQKRNNITACQILANLCTLTLSDRNSNQVNDACSLLWTVMKKYVSEAAPEVLFYRPGWYDRVPWIFYDNTLSVSVLYGDNEKILSEVVEQVYTFQSGLNTSVLQLEVVSYTLDGEYIPVTPLTNQISLCAQPTSTFGTDFSVRCTMSLPQLTTYHTTFYELYVRTGDVLYPVPVLVENTQADISKQSTWVLSRRYFLVDNELGIDSSDGELYVIRYARRITLSVSVSGSITGNIYIPLLSILYDEVKTDNPAISVISELDVKYSNKAGMLSNDISIAVGVVGLLSVIYAGLKAVGYRRRNNIIAECSCETMCSFILYMCSGLGNLMFWVLLGTTSYYLILYKGQRAVSVFLPLDNSPLLAVLITAFSMVLISRLHFLHRSSSYEIFFVDWEKPKGSREASLSSVSIWRTYFLANEWNELHSIRKINTTFQYITFLFITEYAGLKYLATHQPDTFLDPSKAAYVSPYSTILRLGIIFTVFCVLWILQRLYTFLYERFISDQLQMYVDLCSISNISVFILSDVMYGYYIHGRSVHGHADVDMRDIVSALKREEENLCSKRGLSPDTDHQTFQMVIPLLLRTNINRITQHMTNRDITQRQGQETEKQIASYLYLNRLYSSYIDRALDDINYTVGHKLFFEHFLDLEIREPPPGKGILYEDQGQSFENVLYYGNEWLLFTWEVLLVSVLDVLVADFVFAVVLAWFLNEVLLNSFSSWKCRRNVAARALIDERFLI